jgi:hypothetical protein
MGAMEARMERRVERALKVQACSARVQVDRLACGGVRLWNCRISAIVQAVRRFTWASVEASRLALMSSALGRIHSCSWQ